MRIGRALIGDDLPNEPPAAIPRGPQAGRMFNSEVNTAGPDKTIAGRCR